MKLGKNECYCAFCRTPRQIYKKRHVSFLDVLSACFLTLLTMYFIWQGFNPKGLIFIAIYLSVMEIFIGLRWRLMIVCRHCGFDPVMYLKDPSLAAEKVAQHLDRRKKSTDYMFAPPLNIPTQKIVTKLPAQTPKGARVSRVI